MKNALYILDPGALDRIYGPAERADLANRLNLPGPPLAAADALAQPRRLAEMEVLLTGWGAPRLDARFLELAPRLEAVF